MTRPLQDLQFNVQEIRDRRGLTVSLPIAPNVLLSEAVPEGGRESAPNVKLSGPAMADIEFSVGGRDILMQARLSGEWTLACSRCLAEHSTSFEARVEETFPADSDSIDVTEVLRQAALLELPHRSLCSPDCRGLCPRCGLNLNEGACGCAGSPAANTPRPRAQDPGVEGFRPAPPGAQDTGVEGFRPAPPGAQDTGVEGFRMPSPFEVLKKLKGQ